MYLLPGVVFAAMPQEGICSVPLAVGQQLLTLNSAWSLWDILGQGKEKGPSPCSVSHSLPGVPVQGYLRLDCETWHFTGFYEGGSLGVSFCLFVSDMMNPVGAVLGSDSKSHHTSFRMMVSPLGSLKPRCKKSPGLLLHTHQTHVDMSEPTFGLRLRLLSIYLSYYFICLCICLKFL